MKKHTLPKGPPVKRLPFKMKAPNDNLEAYGWSLQWLRYPAADDPQIAGRPVFHLATDLRTIKKYGVDLSFIDPKYIQYMLDQRPEIKKGVEKVRAAGYTPEALEKFRDTVVKTFENHVLIDICQQFFKVAPLVAEFYAAKLAYEGVHGAEKDEEEDEPQREAKTTKSRR
jgi:hypothetical protein